MKKLLLGTTGLISAVALMAGTASAETPKVTVGGFIDFQAGWVDDDLDANQRDYGFRNDTEVNLSIDGKSDAGLGYGAVIDLEADVTADADNQGLNASRTYIYLDGGWGRFELGSNQGAAETMKVDASNLAAATGGINGAWTYFANPVPGAAFISTPSLPLAHGSLAALGGETSENVNKVTYYSPKFQGFQAGVSYSPDSTDRGQTMTRLDNDGASDIFDLALGYEGQWDMITLAAAATGQLGDADLPGAEDLEAWNIGAKVGYAGFSVAGSYGDWSDSLRVGNGDQDYWTLGGAYDFGTFGASVTYMESSVEVAGGDNDFDNLVIGADYKLAPGLTPYAEVSFYNFDTAGAATADNDGTAVIIGTQLAF